MNSSDDVHHMTETIYRNLAEQFNPAIRQILTAAKTYHKTLSAASTAARSYIESLGRLGHNCKNSGQGGTEEIGEAIFRIAEVQKEIQLKYEDTNKSFFAEVVLPLEQKLENDFKNAVAEQKKYHAGHKGYVVPYTKAMEAHKKFLKKNNRSKLAFDDEKEIPLKRTVDRCKEKLDEFRLQGLKLALLEERKCYCYILSNIALLEGRKCYCFILARLCSVSSTQLYYHDRGMDLLTVELGHWKQLCSQPNILPRSADPLLRIADNNTNYSPYMSESGGHSPYDYSSRTSSEEQRSEYALPGSPSTSNDILPRSVAMAMCKPPTGPPPGPPGGMQVRALYGHIGDQESQLSFSMGDAITLLGDPNDGWQFGHNSRTGQYGWFPLSFTDSMETRGQLQTQTPIRRHRPRAKSFSELNGDARSLSDFHGWGMEHEIPGSSVRPRSLHESSLVTAPSMPQLLGQSGGDDFHYFTNTTTAPHSTAIFSIGTRSQPASRAPSRPPSPPLPPPPPLFAHNPGPQPTSAPPNAPPLPATLSRNPSSKSLHHPAEAASSSSSMAVYNVPLPPLPAPPSPHPSPHLGPTSMSSMASQAASMASSLRSTASAGPPSRGGPAVPPRPPTMEHSLSSNSHHLHQPQSASPASSGAPPPPPPPPPLPPPSDSLFASVTLKKAKTNDRSAPRIK
ncbi:hypothetical protein ACOMHN_000425 [Nucella lapillus]